MRELRQKYAEKKRKEEEAKIGETAEAGTGGNGAENGANGGSPEQQAGTVPLANHSLAAAMAASPSRTIPSHAAPSRTIPSHAAPAMAAPAYSIDSFDRYSGAPTVARFCRSFLNSLMLISCMHSLVHALSHVPSLSRHTLLPASNLMYLVPPTDYTRSSLTRRKARAAKPTGGGTALSGSALTQSVTGVGCPRIDARRSSGRAPRLRVAAGGAKNQLAQCQPETP
jgi:hypothetical protein